VKSKCDGQHHEVFEVFRGDRTPISNVLKVNGSLQNLFAGWSPHPYHINCLRIVRPPNQLFKVADNFQTMHPSGRKPLSIVLRLFNHPINSFGGDLTVKKKSKKK